MRILITGADGFAGKHLSSELINADSTLELHGTIFNPSSTTFPQVNYHPLDLRDDQAVAALIEEIAPDCVYHLAAAANVGQSYATAWTTLENNIHSQLNLILAYLKHNLQPRTLIISSGDIYGDALFDAPATEDRPLRPPNPYSVSKVTQDMLALQYYISHQLPIMRARPFNHLGPGQSLGFVAPDFAMQIARIEAGQQEAVMRVGSLTAERDFSDVRDVVRAYRLIMERGTPGEAYNIASGTTCTVQHILDTLLAYSSADIRIEVDPARLRPNSSSKSWGNANLLRTTTGWQPTIALEQTLKDVLEDCRQRVQTQPQGSK